MRFIKRLLLFVFLCLPASAIVLTANWSDFASSNIKRVGTALTPDGIQTNGSFIVSLDPRSGNTDTNGSISWTNVVPNSYWLELNNITKTRIHITITNGTPTNATLNAKDLITVATNNGFNAALPVALSDAKYVQVSSNFLDVANKPAALANIGGLATNLAPGRIFVGQTNGGALGVVMTQDATMNTNGNLVLANTGQARADLGLGSASTNNTIDFQSGNSTLTNLAAGTATALLGTSSTKAAAGNDSRIVNAIPNLAGNATNTAFTASDNTHVPFKITAVAGTTTNMFEVWDASGTNVLFRIKSDGNIVLAPDRWIFMDNSGITGMRWNPNHPGGGEWEITSSGSLSLNVGYNSQGSSAGQIGSSGGYHETWNFQNDLNVDAVTTAGYSKNVRWAVPYYNGGSIIKYVGIRGEARGNNGNVRLVFYNPSHEVSGGFGTNGTYSGGVEQGAVETNGWSFKGVINRDLANSSPASVYSINLKSGIDVVSLGQATTILVTNVDTNAAFTRKEMYFYPGLGNQTVTFTNLINWEGPTGPIPSPTTVTGSVCLHATLTVMVNNGATNYIGNAGYSAYTPVVDANASAFFTASGITDPTIQSAVNTFCLTAKANNFWPNLRAFHPYVGGTSNTCSWNLVNTSLYRIAWNGGMSFASTGITGNGTDAYGDMNLIPSTALTNANTSSMFVWLRGPALPTDSGYFFGTIGNSQFARWGAFRNSSFFQVGGMNANTTSDLTASTGGTFIGFLGQNRTGSTTEQDYLSGVTVGSTTGKTATVGLPTVQNVYILARNGPPADHFSNANLTGDCVAENMTAQNVADLQAAWAAMNAALGR